MWLGLEYFCNEGDGSGRCDDAAFLDFAARELAKIGLIDLADVLDGTVVRVPKAYPAYFGEYRGIGTVRGFLDEWSNVFPVGPQRHAPLQQPGSLDARGQGCGGLHRQGGQTRQPSGTINAEDEYHETRDAK